MIYKEYREVITYSSNFDGRTSSNSKSHAVDFYNLSHDLDICGRCLSVDIKVHSEFTKIGYKHTDNNTLYLTLVYSGVYALHRFEFDVIIKSTYPEISSGIWAHSNGTEL